MWVPVEVAQIRWVAPAPSTHTVVFSPSSVLKIPFKLQGTPLDSRPASRLIPYNPPPGKGGDLILEVTSRMQGDDQLFTSQAVPYYSPLKRHPLSAPALQDVLTQHPFLVWNKSARSLAVKSGTWQVAHPLVLPPNIGLVVSAGTRLQFKLDGLILSQGPLLFEGAKESPITLEGIGNHSWLGVVAMKSETPSRWAHVQVRNTSGVRYHGWEITGAVTFYKSEVLLDHCSFVGNTAEDALNIVQSKFHMINPRFESAASDAFDGDFVQGDIDGGTFEKIQGDAIDVSGSQVNVRDVRLQGIGDKGISAGEKSVVHADRVEFEETGIAAASKDLSLLEISNSRIGRVRYFSLAAYEKKPEYGPGTLNAVNLNTQEENIKKIFVQTGSHVTCDGSQIVSKDFDTKALYQAGILGN